MPSLRHFPRCDDRAEEALPRHTEISPELPVGESSGEVAPTFPQPEGPLLSLGPVLGRNPEFLHVLEQRLVKGRVVEILQRDDVSQTLHRDHGLQDGPAPSRRGSSGDES